MGVTDFWKWKEILTPPHEYSENKLTSNKKNWTYICIVSKFSSSKFEVLTFYCSFDWIVLSTIWIVCSIVLSTELFCRLSDLFDGWQSGNKWNGKTLEICASMYRISENLLPPLAKWRTSTNKSQMRPNLNETSSFWGKLLRTLYKSDHLATFGKCPGFQMC